jgi:hypothetical protein
MSEALLPELAVSTRSTGCRGRMACLVSARTALQTWTHYQRTREVK